MEDQERYGRFKDAPWFDVIQQNGDRLTVVVGGAGGIGRFI